MPLPETDYPIPLGKTLCEDSFAWHQFRMNYCAVALATLHCLKVQFCFEDPVESVRQLFSLPPGLLNNGPTRLAGRGFSRGNSPESALSVRGIRNRNGERFPASRRGLVSKYRDELGVK